MLKMTSKTFIILLAVIVIVLPLTVYQIDQRYIGIEKRLGKIVTDADGKPILKEPGLHIKMPFLTQVVKFDTRIQTMESNLERIPTREQKFVYVDYFVKWKINNFNNYLLSTNNSTEWVNSLLNQKASDALKAEFGKKTIEEVVSEDRNNIMSMITNELERKAQDMGVHVVDMRIKKVELPEQVSESVYNRMRTKREEVANSHRAEGRREAEAIKAAADARKIGIIAEAQKNAKEIKGKAEARAAEIYRNAYSKDQDFFKFYRTLQAYNHAFSDKNSVFVISPDSEFFAYLNKEGKS